MKYTILALWTGVCIVSVCFGIQLALAQGEGFINPPSTDSTSYQDMLPPGAVHEGTQVLHKITSTQENLHLLAGYYYGDPRLWKKIYQDNRNIIKNPNRLPVGQTLRIQVEETWRPRFSYQEWFNLATRNGEWKPGVPWKRAVEVPVPTSKPAATREVPPSEKQEAVPVPQETPEVKTSEKPEAPSEEAPPEEAPPEEASSEEAPPEEAPSEETTAEEEKPTEEEPAEEQAAPAF